MTEVYNNQIACLIVKNRNLPQRRQYHYTNSLLLPTDNQLLGMIANPDILDPTTPDEPTTQTEGDLLAESSNQQKREKAADDKVDSEERAKIKKQRKAGKKIVKAAQEKLTQKRSIAEMEKKIAENEAALKKKAEQVDKKELKAYSSQNQRKYDEVRVHPDGGNIKHDGKNKLRGEDHPVTLIKRHKVSGNINQKKRDHSDHDDIMRNGNIDNRDPDTHNLPDDTRETSILKGYGKKKRKGSNGGAGGGRISGGGSRR
jgi:hypothetical protein